MTIGSAKAITNIIIFEIEILCIIRAIGSSVHALPVTQSRSSRRPMSIIHVETRKEGRHRILPLILPRGRRSPIRMLGHFVIVARRVNLESWELRRKLHARSLAAADWGWRRVSSQARRFCHQASSSCGFRLIHSSHNSHKIF